MGDPPRVELADHELERGMALGNAAAQQLDQRSLYRGRRIRIINDAIANRFS